MVLKADSQAAGSGLFKEQRIDLEKHRFSMGLGGLSIV
jgi:hypothetical protein